MLRDSERFGHTRLCEDVFERQELDTLRVSLDWGGNFGTEHEQVATTVHEQVVWAYGFKPADTLAALLQPTVRPARLAVSLLIVGRKGSRINAHSFQSRRHGPLPEVKT